MKQKTSFSLQRGVGMLEVLIALLVLAIGVLGFAGLQMTALSKSNEANHRAAAVLIAQDAIERIELNLEPPSPPDTLAASVRDAYLTGWSAGTPGAVPSGDCIKDTPCTAEQMVAWDINQLTWQAANFLPGGRVMVRGCGFNSLTCVVVSWEEQDPADCLDGGGPVMGEGSKCFVLEVAR